MSNEILMIAAAEPRRSPPRVLARTARFLAIGAVAGIIAAGAAHLSSYAATPVWAMFMGWVAYFTRGHSAGDGLRSYACLALGLSIGFGARVALGLLGPATGSFALPIVVFAVALLVISLRAVPALNNIAAYFMGIISIFAADALPTLTAFAELGSASAIGSLAAWLASTAQARLFPEKQPNADATG